MATEADRRRKLVQEYRQRSPSAGVYQIRNTANGKILLGSRLALDGALDRHRFQLSHGSHRNAQLQREWNEYGPAVFTFEVLEVVKPKDEPGYDLDAELSLLEEIWLEQLRPFGERGYNETDRLRQV